MSFQNERRLDSKIEPQDEQPNRVGVTLDDVGTGTMSVRGAAQVMLKCALFLFVFLFRKVFIAETSRSARVNAFG